MPVREQKAYKVTVIGLVVNVLLTAAKLFAGVVGHSAAIIADAFHSLSDAATDLVLLWGLKEAGKPVDQGHAYGHGKVETMAAVFIGFVLFVVGLKFLGQGGHQVYMALTGDALAAPGWIAFYAALLCVLLKEWVYRVSKKVADDIESKALLANAWHHRSDVFSSVGVLAGVGGAIVLGERWRILDPVAAVGVSLYIIKTALQICFESVNELLDASLCEETRAEILRLAQSVEGTQKPHDLRTRRIGKVIAIEMHVMVDPGLNVKDAHNIATEVENKIKERFGPGTFISVHIEPKI